MKYTDNTFTVIKVTLALLVSTFTTANSFAYSSKVEAHLTSLTVEERRIESADIAIPSPAKVLTQVYQNFTQQIATAQQYDQLNTYVVEYGHQLWQESVVLLAQLKNFDDRSLYWSRLKMSKALRGLPLFSQLSTEQQENLLWQFELASRGQKDIHFTNKNTKKILVTGFDPFFLDKNIDQSNPSGVAALALDNTVIGKNGQLAEIQSVIFPVRFADFDQGMVEKLLATHIDDVDMIVTVSMGRAAFDLERFPSLRRSAKAPDNLNVYTGASSKQPLIPQLNNLPLQGPEFVEFSLPVDAMLKAKGVYKINDNHQVTTKEKTFKPENYAQLRNETSVQGSGGGYLSNEISYRSIIFKNKHRPTLPIGHIHTPRISAFQPDKTADIVAQIVSMLTYSITEI